MIQRELQNTDFAQIIEAVDIFDSVFVSISQIDIRILMCAALRIRAFSFADRNVGVRFAADIGDEGMDVFLLYSPLEQNLVLRAQETTVLCDKIDVIGDRLEQLENTLILSSATCTKTNTLRLECTDHIKILGINVM